MDINPETNLPALPDGYWWRIERDSGAYHDLLTVRVMGTRKKSRWWTERPHPTKTEVYSLAYGNEYWRYYLLNPDETIQELVKFVYAKIQEQLKRQDNEAHAESLLGDYPPKVFPTKD